MADSDLSVSIASQEVRVGDPDNSKVSIDIKNTTSAKVTYTLFVTLPTALVAGEKVGDIVFGPLEATTQGVPQPTDGTRWRIGSQRGTTIQAGDKVTLTLSMITATSTGAIGIEWSKGPTPIGSAALDVTVLAQDDLPKIISFQAEKYVLTWIPGKKSPVKLKWETDDKSTVEITRLGTRLLPTSGRDSAEREQSDWWPDSDYDSSGIQPYQLTATAKGRTVSRWLFVRIQDPGWNKIECSQGGPTLLLNDGDNSLYGVFHRDTEVAVYQLDPEAGTLGKDDKFICKVPAGMEKSPGAFLQNKIWLVGGSQIDPEVCSNKVWWFDPVAKTEGTVDASWTPRMGHACTVFDDKLWILGGVDENGNTVSDVLSSSDGKSWSPGPKLPKPLCLLTATAFDGRLWVYGGADAPFGTPRTGLYSLGPSSSGWQARQFYSLATERPDVNPGCGDPYGSALCVGKDTEGSPLLYMLGTFQDKTITDTMYRLTGWKGQAASLEIHQDPITEANGWPKRKQSGDTLQAFRLSAVGFKDFIFVVSLVYGAENRSLTYLVQS